MERAQTPRRLPPSVSSTPESVRPEPWPAAALRWLLAANGVALAMIAVSWWGAGGATSTSTALSWLYLAPGGVLVAGAANGIWLLRGRRAVGLERIALLPRRRAVLSAPSGSAVPASSPLLATALMNHYHGPECPVVAGKRIRPLPVDAHRRAGRRPCGICRP